MRFRSRRIGLARGWPRGRSFGGRVFRRLPASRFAESGRSCDDSPRGSLAQLVRAPRLHRGCRGFESLWAHNEEPERYENRSGFRISEGDEIVCNPVRDY